MMADDCCPIKSRLSSLLPNQQPGCQKFQVAVHAVWAWTCYILKSSTNYIAQAHTQPMQFSMSFMSPFQEYFLMKCMSVSILDMMALAVRED